MIKSIRGSQDWILSIVWVMVLAVIFGVLMTLVYVVDQQIETGNYELSLYAKRIIYSPNCFAKTGENQIGFLDNKKISEQGLSECFASEEKSIGVRVFVHGSKDLFFNKKYYEDIEPISFFEGYLNYVNTFFVKILNEDNSVSFVPVTIRVVSEK